MRSKTRVHPFVRCFDHENNSHWLAVLWSTSWRMAECFHLLTQTTPRLNKSLAMFPIKSMCMEWWNSISLGMASTIWSWTKVQIPVGFIFVSLKKNMGGRFLCAGLKPRFPEEFIFAQGYNIYNKNPWWYQYQDYLLRPGEGLICRLATQGSL